MASSVVPLEAKSHEPSLKLGQFFVNAKFCILQGAELILLFDLVLLAGGASILLFVELWKFIHFVAE